MSTLSTTKMSSKGQVVIPEDIRSKLGLTSGSRFVVLGEKDVVILKTIAPPAMQDFDDIIKTARKQAKDAGLTKDDILESINEVRGKH